MIKTTRLTHLFLATTLCTLAACGDDSNGDGGIDPTDVVFGDTALVVVINPVINDNNDQNLPEPGVETAGVTITSDDGITATTNAEGIAVLAPLTPGVRTFEVTGGDVDGSFSVTMTSGHLREIGVAVAAAGVAVMVEIDYRSDQIVEVTPDMSNAQVNEALAVSDTVVFFGGGTYTGDIDFSGSAVTLFGEGVLGGDVVLDGNLIISGSDSRIRGTHVTGNVTIPASGVGLSFSRVDGAFVAEGSDATMLANSLCGQNTITGSGSIAVGNTGLAPAVACQ